MEQDQELGGGIGVIFVPAKSFKTLQADGPIPGGRKALDQVGTSRKGLRPGADAGKLIGIEDVLAVCEATPASHFPGWARLVL